MRRPLVLAFACLAAAVPRPAAASPGDAPDTAEPPVGVALATAAATALVPLALGAAHTANASTNGSRNVGYMVAATGMALSPIAGHVVLGEYARGAVFGSVPVGAVIAIATLVTVNPDAVFAGTMGTRTTFGILFSATAFGAALGMVDVALARGRERDKLPAALRGAMVTPLALPGGAGVGIGGFL